MLDKKCKEFGLVRVRNLVFGVRVKLFIQGGNKRGRGGIYLISEIPPGLSTEPITSII